MTACLPLALAVSLALASSAGRQDAPAEKTAPKPDCPTLLSSNPGPGVAQLCQAEDEMRMSGGNREGDGRTHMTAAAALFDRASRSLRDPVLTVYALETLAELYDAQHLDEPRGVEQALRALVPQLRHSSGPLRRLAKLEEEQGLVDAAENTLLSARQQVPDDVEVYRALSEFFARRMAEIPAASRQLENEHAPAAAPGQPDEAGYYAVGGDIPPPEVVESVDPPLPPEAEAAGVKGVVTAEIYIDETGRVTSAKLLRVNPLLEESATAALKQRRYAPTIIEGRAVPVKMTVTLDYVRK
jgi:TonB family protein